MNINKIQLIVRLLLDGALPKKYMKAVKNWLCSDGFVEEYNQQLHEAWDEQQHTIGKEKIRVALETFRYNRQVYMDRHRKRNVIFVGMKYAATILLAVATTFVAWNLAADRYSGYSEMAECSVLEGKMDSVMLSDATKIFVNAGSTVLYPKQFNQRNATRDVYVYGEVRFGVSKDASHPFIVHVGKLKVKVLGTQFGVKAYPSDSLVTVTLEEGLVKVYDDKSAMLLHPNEQLVYDRVTGRMDKNIVDAVAYNSWKDGNLDFVKRPLREILADLEHRFNVRFNVRSNVNINKRYTMSFRKEESLDRVLTVIADVSGDIKYKQSGNVITLYKFKNNKYE